MSTKRRKPAVPEIEAAVCRATPRGDAPAAVRSGLLAEVRELILTTRQTVAHGVNAALAMLYWQIGGRIRSDILADQRAEYGQQIIATLGQQLENEFGRGFGKKNLRRMVQFAEVFPDEQIVVSLIRQLSWTHVLALIPLKDPLQREFYAEMCRVEGWSVRTLRAKIGGMLYERTALSKKPAELIRQELAALREADTLTPDLVFKDPYFLDFLGLRDTYSERDLETAILREIERFLLEMGAGFAFVERQKRIVVDGEDFYLDLLFFHRRLRRLVLVELKLDAFRPADFGQTTFYLRWLDRHERQPGEEPPHPPAVGTRPDPVRGQVCRADRTARTGKERHPRGGIPHRAAVEGIAAAAPPRGCGPGPGAAGAARGGRARAEGGVIRHVAAPDTGATAGAARVHPPQSAHQRPALPRPLRQKKAIAHLRTSGRVSNQEYQNLLSVAKRTAHRDLLVLIEKGVIERVGTTGKGTYYVLVKGPQRGQTGHEARTGHEGAKRAAACGAGFRDQFRQPQIGRTP